MANQQLVANLYNPQSQSRQELIDGFVVRLDTFQKLYREIKDADMQTPPQHLLIVGQRGMGKSTMLLRLSYEVENDPALNSWLIPIVYSEEQYQVNTLAKLWEETAKHLEEKNRVFSGLAKEMDNLFDPENTDRFEETVFRLLTDSLQKENKKLLLFIDNIGDLLQKLSKKEAQRLREILMTSSDIRFIGASSSMIESFFKYDKPFYEFFKQYQLEGLGKEQTRELLKKLGEHYHEDHILDILKQEPGRVESMRRLTGGVIRTMVLLFEIFLDRESGTAFKDLELLLDRVTPLYKHRMDDLSSQQQQIVHAIAMAWDGVTTADIAKATRLASKKVSAQLTQLVTNQIITKVETGTKNHLYRVQERFFNIWQLMRYGRQRDKNRVIWLTRFFEAWCDGKRFSDRAKKHIKALEDNPSLKPENAYFISEALAGAKGITKTDQHELLQTTKAYLEKKDPSLAQLLSTSDIELNQDGETAFTAKDYETAIEKLEKIKDKDAEAYRKLSICYQTGLKAYDKAEEALLISIEKGSEKAFRTLGDLYADDLNNDGKALEWLIKAAEHQYSQANKHTKGESLNSLALLYKNNLKDFLQAEKYFLLAIEEGEEYALRNLGDLYADDLNNNEKALQWLTKAAEHQYSEANKELKGLSLSFLAWFYKNNLKDFLQAEKYFLLAIEEGEEYPLKNLGDLYADDLNNNEKALQWLTKAAEHQYSEANKELKGQSLSSLAWFYKNNLKDFLKAEKYFLLAIEEENEYAILNLGDLYARYLNNNEKALEWLTKAAEHQYSEANKNRKGQSMNALAWFLFTQRLELKNALTHGVASFELEAGPYTAHTYACILAWGEKFELAWEVANEFLWDEEAFKEFPDDIITFFSLLLAKGQYQEILDYFQSHQTKEFHGFDKLKPIYYALMHYMKDEYPNEYLKMGPELQETVEEIIAKVEQMRVDYAIPNE